MKKLFVDNKHLEKTIIEVDNNLTVAAALHSIPKWIEVTSNKDYFNINVKYFYKEKPHKKVFNHKGIIIIEGRNSRTILNIKVPTSHKDIKIQIWQAFDKRMEGIDVNSWGDVPDFLNQIIIESFLQENLDTLLL